MDTWDDYDDGGGAAPQGAEGQQGEELPDLQKPKPKSRRAPAKKRPKLTIEDLEKPSALQDVYENFPKWFAEGYRGKGHEVRDLRRLLELYQRWQPRVFNHCSYNQFEQTLEKMSGAHALKVRQQQQRQREQQREQQQQQQQQWMEAATPAVPVGVHPGSAAMP
uniref:Chromosome segregation in meiosis protein 3 domain-containing protein n=1 Tax=Tetradesmus obliquus TaxID=3088 RepID=A0A383WQ18_TETOB|eukprot:jgi/Sobl393_1/8973/SZX79383.1